MADTNLQFMGVIYVINKNPYVPESIVGVVVKTSAINLLSCGYIETVNTVVHNGNDSEYSIDFNFNNNINRWFYESESQRDYDYNLIINKIGKIKIL